MKTAIKIYIALTGLLVLDAALFVTAGISFAGTLADQLLFWLWLAGTFYILVRYRRSLWVKIYTGLLLVLLFAAALPMGAPLVMLNSFAFGKEVSYQAGDIRVTETFKSPLARPYISAIRSFGWYEQEIAMLDPEFDIQGEIYRLKDVTAIKEIEDGDRHALAFIFKMGYIAREIP